MYGCMAKTEQLGLGDVVLREIELGDQTLIVLQDLNDKVLARICTTILTDMTNSKFDADITFYI